MYNYRMRRKARSPPEVNEAELQLRRTAEVNDAERRLQRAAFYGQLLLTPWRVLGRFTGTLCFFFVVVPLFLDHFYLRLGAEALTAHDCESPDTTSFPLDLMSPADCPDPEKDYAKPETINLQVLRMDGPIAVDAGYCRATARRTVARCGWRLKSNSQRISVPTSPVTIDEKQCWHLLQTGELIYDGKSFRMEKGVLQSFAYFSHGSADEAGNCEHVPMLHSGGKTYVWHYEEVELIAKYDHVTALMDVDKGMIRFSNGLKMSEEVSSLFDQEKGRVVWRRREIKKCTDDLSEVYRGKAEFRKYIGQQVTKPLRKRRVAPSQAKSVTMIDGSTNLDAVQRMGLYYGEGILKCGRHCHKVENLPDFLACEYNYGVPQFANLTFRPEAMGDIRTAQAGTKILSDLQHIATAFRTEQKFEQLVKTQCAAETRNKKLKLSTVTMGNPYSLVHEFGRGHQLVPLQGVAYVRRCPPVEVTRAFLPELNCTKELPVYKGTLQATKEKMADSSNNTAQVHFMNTITRVLQKYPTVIPCANEMPALWKDDDGQWQTIHPAQIMRKVPQQLRPETPGYKFDSSFSSELGPSGLFSPEQHARMNRLADAATYRDGAVTTVVANQLDAEARDPDGHLGSIISMDDIKRTSWNAVKAITPELVWSILGESAMAAMAWLSMLSFACFFLGVAAHWVILWATKGWDKGRIFGHMCLACCGVIDLPYQLAKATINLGKKGLDINKSSLGPLMKLADRWNRKKKDDDAEAAAGNGDVEAGGSNPTAPEASPGSAASSVTRNGQQASARATSAGLTGYVPQWRSPATMLTVQQELAEMESEADVGGSVIIHAQPRRGQE